MSHKQSNITIRRKDMESLRGLNWLNDEIMNVYVNLLQVRSLAAPLTWYVCKAVKYLP